MKNVIYKVPINETSEQREARYARYRQEEIDKAHFLKTDPDSIISRKEKAMADKERGTAFDQELLSMEIDESCSHFSKKLETLSKWNEYEGPVDYCNEFRDGIYDGMCASADPVWVRIKKNEWVVLDQNWNEEHNQICHHIYLTYDGWEVAF